MRVLGVGGRLRWRMALLADSRRVPWCRRRRTAFAICPARLSEPASVRSWPMKLVMAGLLALVFGSFFGLLYR